MTLRHNFIGFILLICITACGHEEKPADTKPTSVSSEFDSVRWRAKEGLNYAFREEMINGIINDQEIRSLRKDQILLKLGIPDREDNGHLFYTISQRHLGLFPLHTKTMVIKLKNDNSVEWIKLHE